MKEVKTPKKPLAYYYGIVLIVLIVFNLVVTPILMDILQILLRFFQFGRRDHVHGICDLHCILNAFYSVLDFFGTCQLLHPLHKLFSCFKNMLFQIICQNLSFFNLFDNIRFCILEICKHIHLCLLYFLDIYI